MSKQQPGNSGQDRDPWGGRSKGSRDHNQLPPDLSDIWAHLTKKLKRFGTADSNNGRHGSGNGGRSDSTFKWLCLAAVALIIVWALSGFYTIKEAERGVITRFGRLSHQVLPGLNWRANFIDQVTPVNIESVRELSSSGFMLTRDENVVRVEMNVQYKVVDPAKYLFSVTSANESLRQATDSALRYVVGHTTMDEVLTRGRAKVRHDTWQLIDSITAPYDMGLQVIDVNFQPARPPEEVKAAFDDAISAQEDQQRFIREAEAYAREQEPKSRGEAKRLEEEAMAYKETVILHARGEVARFSQLLPQYLHAPKITRDRLYIETMERLLKNTRKVLVNTAQGNNVMVIPLEKLLKGSQITASVPGTNVANPQVGTASEQTLSELLHPAPNTIPMNGTNRRGRVLP